MPSLIEQFGVCEPSTPSLGPRHRWYVAKESFSGEFVEAVLRHECTDAEELVIDPFSGGGSTPLTAASLSLSAVGIEVNPFLAFVSRAKLSRERARSFSSAKDRVLSGIGRGAKSPLEGYSTFTSNGDGTRGLFNEEVLRAFEGARRRTPRLSPPCARLTRLALIGAAMDNCNAARDGKAFRYRAKRRDAGFGADSFTAAFLKRCEEILVDLDTDLPSGSRRSIWLGDARSKLRALRDSRFGICVTSPPYLNSSDYSDVYRPELFLGKFVTSTAELREIRLRTVRSHVQANWRSPIVTDFGELYESCSRDICERVELLWDHRIPSMIQAYFEDLSTIFERLRERAADGASLWLVVSTSAYAGVEIPVDRILAEVGSRQGWSLRELAVLRELRSSGQHWRNQNGGRRVSDRNTPPLHESVLVFDANR